MKIKRSSFTTTLFYWITLLIIHRNTNCFGQDTIRHYPELKKSRKEYIYGDKRISEKEMQTQLVLLGNAEITKQVKLAKKSKDLQGIGYWAIPFGTAATCSLIFPLFQSYDSEAIAPLCYGATFMAIGSSVYFKINSNKKNARALRLYKEYYSNQ